MSILLGHCSFDFHGNLVVFPLLTKYILILQEELINGFSNKQPKIVAACAALVNQAIRYERHCKTFVIMATKSWVSDSKISN